MNVIRSKTFSFKYISNRLYFKYMRHDLRLPSPQQFSPRIYYLISAIQFQQIRADAI